MSGRQPAKATDIYRRLAKLAPKDPRLPYLMGVSLQAQGKTAEAKKQFQAASDLSPAFVEPLRQLTAIDLGRKDQRAAIDRLTRAVEKAPTSGPLHQLLADLYLQLGDLKKAEPAYLKAVELEPRLFESYVRLGNIYMRSGRLEQALASIDKAAVANARNPMPHMLKGVIYQYRQDIPQAREAYERALTVDPRFAPAANNLAWLLAEHGGDKEKALQLAQLAKEAMPDDPSVNDTLGWVLYRRGVYDRAVRVLSESAAKMPNEATVHYHLGMASAKTGDRAGARRALETAVKLSPQFAGREEAQKTLADLR
jgi:tetratricopeptide (TPR) repeat protein